LQSLRQEYAITNLNYFDNKLPKDTKIIRIRNLKDELGKSSMAQTKCVMVLYLQCTIWIDPDKSPTKGSIFMTLFHETCHVKTWNDTKYSDDHAQIFQDCMTDLADRGAFRNWW
jgi:hypothetical protein